MIRHQLAGLVHRGIITRFSRRADGDYIIWFSRTEATPMTEREVAAFILGVRRAS